ncbi:MAG TPA: hypothetical protein VI670_09250 [Thermoanaerobaculia bacterium]|jgi:hypothetical protein
MRWVKKGLIFAPPAGLGWMRTHASVPCADPLGGHRYRVYFAGRDDAGRSQTGFFEIDLRRPHETLRVSARAVVAPGAPGLFDDAGAMPTWILTRGSEKLLYYIGWNTATTVPFRNALGLAISRDGGETFEKLSRGPILDRSPADPCFVASACVLPDQGRWRMWYLSCIGWEMVRGKLQHRYHIKYAESDDGIAWRRDGHVCIDFRSPDEYAISRPSVERDGGRYRMWYSHRGASYRIGYAESADGLQWARRDEDAGIDVSAEGWDSEMIEYPHVVRHDGRRYLFYNGNGYGESGIGLAAEE